MKATKHSALLLISIFSLCARPVISYSAEEEPRTPEGTRYRKNAFIGGASSGGKSSYKATESGGTGLGTSNDSATSFVLFATELTYQKHLLGAGLLVEGTRYSYSAGGPADGELGVYFMPRLAHSFGPVELWAGVGVGIMITTFGSSDSGTEDGVTVVLDDSSATSFAWTPRAGIDVDLGQRYFIGAQISYTHTSFSVPFSAIVGPNSITIFGSEDCTRNWIGAALRFGTRI